MKKFIYKLSCICICLSFVATIYASEAKTLLEHDITNILQIINTNKGESNKPKRHNEIKKILNKRFNFIEMSKRALGKEWKSLTKDQKKEFTSLFQNLLEDTYIEKMEQYTDEKIRFEKEKNLKKNKISIETILVTKESDIPIIYKLISRNNEWKVYDVNIEGVGLINNYRTQFKKILFEESFDALMQKLRKKINENS